MDPLLNGEFHTATWVKSSFSGPDGGNCVEVARLAEGWVGVRDSKDRTGPALVFALSEWAAFVNGVKGGHFD